MTETTTTFTISRDTPVTELAQAIMHDKAINEIAWKFLSKLKLEDLPEHLRTVGGLVDHRKDAEKFFNLQKGFGKTTIPQLFEYIERKGVVPEVVAAVEAGSITREYGAQALAEALIFARQHSANISNKLVYGTLAGKLKTNGLPNTPACQNAGTIADNPLAAVDDLVSFGWQRKEAVNLISFLERDGLEINPEQRELLKLEPTPRKPLPASERKRQPKSTQQRLH